MRVAPLQPSWLVAVSIILTCGNFADATPRLDSEALPFAGTDNGYGPLYWVTA